MSRSRDEQGDDTAWVVTVPSKERPAGARDDASRGVLRAAQLVAEEELGRGRMGTVHRARDTRLLRNVAVKRMDPVVARVPSQVRAFVEEAQIGAQLDHPNVVPIHDLGADASGVPYFSMKLVRGVGFGQWLADPSRPVGSSERLDGALEIFLKVCEGVAFAHSRGVLHRNLEPSNVMVGDFGEVYVMDWGLARVLGTGVRLAHAPAASAGADPFGTPAYMSPEAAMGRDAECDERIDVFGLGAILYEIVTGRSPYPSDDPRRALRAARAGAVTPAESVLGRRAVPRGLLRIVEKALAPAPADRHESVLALRRDVQRFLRQGLLLPTAAFSAGTRIVAEGEPGDVAYIVTSGSCEAYKTVAGSEVSLRIMGPGDVFGETSVLSGQPRTASVRALGDVTAMVVSRAALDEGMGAGSWALALVRALAERFCELDRKLHGS